MFSSGFEIAPPAHLRFERNGWDYDSATAREGSGSVYTPEASEVDREMGAIPAAVLAMPGRVRGRHPLDSFAATGPRAAELVNLPRADGLRLGLCRRGRAEEKEEQG